MSAFTPKIAALLDMHGDAWNAEGADVESDGNDALNVVDAYAKNTNTKIQLQNFVTACVNAHNAVETAMTIDGLPAAEFGTFDRSTFTDVDCVQGRTVARWLGAADGMQYTVLHMTHVVAEGGGPKYTTDDVFTLDGNNFLDRMGAQARPHVEGWFNDWANFPQPASATGGFGSFNFNLTGYPIAGGTAGNTGSGQKGPFVPLFGVLLNLRLGTDTLFKDIRDITGLMGKYLSANARAQMNAIQNIYLPAAQAANKQAMINEGFINANGSTKGLEDSFNVDTVNSACNAGGRISKRWYDKGFAFNTDYLQKTYDSRLPWTPPVDNVRIWTGLWNGPLDRARSFGHWLMKPCGILHPCNDPYAPVYALTDRWQQCTSIRSGHPWDWCASVEPTPPGQIPNPCGQPLGSTPTSLTITAQVI